MPAPRTQEQPRWGGAGAPGPACSARPYLRGRGPGSARPDGAAPRCFSCQPERQGRGLSRVSVGLERPESSRVWPLALSQTIHVFTYRLFLLYALRCFICAYAVNIHATYNHEFSTALWIYAYAPDVPRDRREDQSRQKENLSTSVLPAQQTSWVWWLST